MRTRRRQRGFSILEAIIAMAVLMVGAAGMVGLVRQSTFFMGDARRATRAAGFAQDLVNQIELWEYTDARLSNANTGNDADLGDSNDALAVDVPAVTPDHAEADLTSGGAVFNGISSEMLVANGMERYWNVAPGEDYNANGIADSMRIAVIVRWKTGATWRKAVFMLVKVNGADSR